ncbi:MFS transporter [Chloroflexota bacterium]
MVKRRGFPKMFFGWWTVISTGILSGLGSGFTHYGISVFFKPIAADLGFSRAVASTAAAVGRLEGGLGSPLAGWLADKYGPRLVIFIGSCIVLIGLVLMNYVNSLWAYLLVWGVLIGLGNNLAYTVAADKAITSWFVRKRGLAIGIRFVIWGVCGVILLPIVTWLVTTEGWRMTNLIWAGVILVTLPLAWFLIKPSRPEYYGLLPDGAIVEEEAADTSQMIDKGVKYAAETEEVEFTLRQAMKTRSYWMLLVSWACGMIVMGGLNIHIIPFLTDMSIDPIIAGSMMAMMVFFTIPGRFLGGVIADRLKINHLQFFLAGSFFFLAAGITAIIIEQTISMVYVFLVLYGFGSGASTPMRLMIGSRYFGRKAFGSILGSILMIEAPLGFIAPIYAGWIYDTTGSYIPAFITFTVLTVFAMFLMFLVRPPKPPAEVTDVNNFM